MAQHKGWKGERGLHAKAGKGEKAEGQGFHGHSKDHAKAAKSDKKSGGLFGKLTGR